MTQPELDRRCENYLKGTFQEAVDFALENSLPLLMEDGLIRRDAEVISLPIHAFTNLPFLLQPSRQGPSR